MFSCTYILYKVYNFNRKIIKKLPDDTRSMGVFTVEYNVDAHESNVGGTFVAGWIDDDRMSGLWYNYLKSERYSIATKNILPRTQGNILWRYYLDNRIMSRTMVFLLTGVPCTSRYICMKKILQLERPDNWKYLLIHYKRERTHMRRIRYYLFNIYTIVESKLCLHWNTRNNRTNVPRTVDRTFLTEKTWALYL